MMKKAMLLTMCIMMSATMLQAKIVTQDIEYKEGETVLEGYLAYDDAVEGERPGVLVIHDWNGLGDYEKMRCRKLAELGYVAFAADIYGKGIRPENAQESSKQASKYRGGDRQNFRRRLVAGLEQLRARPESDNERIAAIGYCFGGTGVLELARTGADIQGVVSFHGGLDSKDPEAGKNIKCKVLVLHGADDPYVESDDIAALQQELRTGNVDWQMIYYGNAVHSFTEPDAGSDNSSGAAYNEKADRRSWEHMKLFFDEIFKK